MNKREGLSFQEREKDGISRREFLSGAAGFLGSVFIHDTARATQKLNRMLEDASANKERAPKFSVEIFYGRHGTEKDITAEFKNKFAAADIYAPELVRWDRETQDAYQAISNGEKTPEEYFAEHPKQKSSIFYAFRHAELDLLYQSKKNDPLC